MGSSFHGSTDEHSTIHSTVKCWLESPQNGCSRHPDWVFPTECIAKCNALAKEACRLRERPTSGGMKD
jgi:hypothetical protein